MSAQHPIATRRAEPPRIPPHTRASEKEQRARTERLHERCSTEHKRIARGLFWLGLIVLAFAIARAGLDRAFVPGWWRQW